MGKEGLEEKLNKLSLRLFREQSNVSCYFITRNLCGDCRVVLISRFRQKAMFLCISISRFVQISLCDGQEHSASKKSNVSNNAKKVKHQKENIVIKGIGKLKKILHYTAFPYF